MNSLLLEFPPLRPANGGGPSSLVMAHILSTLSDATRDAFPALADIHDDVRRQWLDAKRGEATDKLYQALLKGYTIRIEPLEEKKVAQVH